MDSYEINHLQNKRIAEAVRKLNDYPKEDFNKQNTIIEKPSSIKSLQIISDQVKEPIIHIAEDESPKVNPKEGSKVPIKPTLGRYPGMTFPLFSE